MLDEQTPADTGNKPTEADTTNQSNDTNQASDKPVAKKAATKKAAAKQPQKKTQKKTPAKKAAPKKTADKSEGKPDQPGEQSDASGSGAPPALFQQPESKPAPARKRAAKKATAEATSADGGATDQADESGEDNQDDSAQGDATRRRRRRGGRRRRKPGGGGEASGEDPGADSGADERGSSDSADASSDADDEGADGMGSGDGQSPTSRRRRRRRRAGDSDGDPDRDDDPQNTVTRVRQPRSLEDEITGVSGSTRLEAKKQRRKEGREAGRRRAPIVSEAEFLARREAVERAMVIRQREDLTQIAVLEDKVLVEHYVARESQTSLIGNVYLGRVQNVLPSMEAAFIDIGKGRNAVLYAGEVNWDALGAKEGGQRKIEQVLKSGQSVLVQVTKDPVGHKGARLTSQISLPGRFLVYVPGAHTNGISRKLPDNERNRLKNLLKDIVPASAGVIVRTAAEGASEKELTRDVERLKSVWEEISEKSEGGSAPQVLYTEPALTLKVVRDLFTEDIGKLVVSGDDAWDLVEGYVKHVAPDLADRLERHNDSELDAFADHRLDEQIAKALERKVWLPSGGSLVIDRTEAMTVVDVNTGKFTGSGGNLEETVTKNNLEAAEEIVRQLRLRDIGGIIVIDFIDMVLESNRDLVLRRLIECLGRDRTRHQVAEVTSLGLVQMTRKRIGTGLLEAFSTPCEECQGRGLHVHSEPVEPRAKPKTDDEPRRGRRGRGRARDSDNASAKEDTNGAGRRPSPAEFAAMAGANATQGLDGEDAQGPDAAEADASAAGDVSADSGANDSLTGPEADAGTEPNARPEPDASPEPDARPESDAGPNADAGATEDLSTDGAAAADGAEPATDGAEPATDGIAPAADGVAPEPETAVAPSGPRVVTSVRRSASRPAGPPAGGVPASASDEASTSATEESEEVSAAAQAHVPVKRKGARRR